jgi:A/G-specific adenine glycosylase
MLQQTQAARVVPAYGRFLELFPTVEALARASRADVVRAWAGLGYNRRAVALSEAARAIVRDYGGRVPSRPGVLKRLPGVGPYTAAAVASFAFGVAVAAVDTNVRRVVARARLGREPSDLPARAVEEEAERWLDRRHPDEWNQALMDLGRAVCRPRPMCAECPLAATCRFRRVAPMTGASRRQSEPFEGTGSGRSRAPRAPVAECARPCRGHAIPARARCASGPRSCHGRDRDRRRRGPGRDRVARAVTRLIDLS